MAISKNGNGMMHGEEPAPLAGAAGAEHAGHKASATRTSRIAGRPARPANDAAVPAEDRVLKGIPSRTERKYSFNTIVAVGVLGYLVGRLLSH